MELFNIYNNLIMRSVPFIVNEIEMNETIDEHQSFRLFLDSVGLIDKQSNIKNNPYIKSNLIAPESDNCFIAKSDEHFYLLNPINSPLPVVFSRHEKEYIKLLLQDPEARCFMDEELVDKLNEALSEYDVSYIKDNYIEREMITRKIDEEKLRKRVLILADALRKEKKIKYVYESPQGDFEGTASPYKLMYSLRERVLRLAACPDNSHDRFILMNLDRFVSIEITDINSDADPERFYSSQRRKLILKVENDKKRKTVERCMRVFSSYRRKTIYNVHDDTVTLEVDFYLFDRDSLIGDILSLGSAAQVIEVRKPIGKKEKFIKDDNFDLRSIVIEKLRTMYNNMD